MTGSVSTSFSALRPNRVDAAARYRLRSLDDSSHLAAARERIEFGPAAVARRTSRGVETHYIDVPARRERIARSLAWRALNERRRPPA